MSSTALDDARSRVASVGGTLGEQLVASGAVADDDLTDFYRQRLLVPQVNPNTLARLSHKVVASIPTDMAIELRAIPVSLDGENNLTVAMSDPSDRHAVDEIAFFTGTYVVRAVATQMQIAWCLAHYYGHVTTLGQRLIQPQSEPAPIANRAVAVGGRAARTRGLTDKVEATRHRAVAPVSEPVDLARPTSGELDLVAVAAKAEAAPEPVDAEGEKPRARSVSGEIRVPSRRAPSIRPPMPPVHEDEGEDESKHKDEDDRADEPDEAVITLEAGTPDEDPTGPRKLPPRRPQKANPPELAARAGEVDIATGPIKAVELDEPRIVIADDLVEPRPGSQEMSGEFRIVARPPSEQPVPALTIEVDDTAVGVVIHDDVQHDSEPVLLERQRRSAVPVEQADDDDSDVVVLEARKPQPTPPAAVRVEPRGRTTKVGMGAASPRGHHDTEATGVPAMLVDGDADPTLLDTRAAPPRTDDTDETIAAPRRPAGPDDTSPIAAPPLPRAVSIKPIAVVVDDDDNDGEEDTAVGGETAVMSVPELDRAIPQRATERLHASIDFRDERRTEPRRPRMIDHDAIDDGWGPPGTTIPPPLLGAMPGTGDDDDDDDRESSGEVIPLPNIDTAPLIVAPPSPPEPARGTPALRDVSGSILVRALEEATARSLELIHALERAKDRDGVVALMVAHLAETHRRAGFFSIKPGTPTTAGAAPRAPELAVFSIEPVPPVLPVTALRLDQPSTLQDVVGTRLPYRGPMHDDASRNFLAAGLGACPPEILLVPVAIRERVVGVLFGEHRMRHTFDDQLALAARAAGMALERILKAKRV